LPGIAVDRPAEGLLPTVGDCTDSGALGGVAVEGVNLISFTKMQLLALQQKAMGEHQEGNEGDGCAEARPFASAGHSFNLLANNWGQLAEERELARVHSPTWRGYCTVFPLSVGMGGPSPIPQWPIKQESAEN
jgi:hypothetical protein